MSKNNQEKDIVIAETRTVKYAMQVLKTLQQTSRSRIWCDPADSGKTVTLTYYADTNHNVGYIDCSIHKTRTQLIRAIADAFYLDSSGRLADIFKKTVAHLKSLKTPMIILDEAGDQDYKAFLEAKAYFNALNPPGKYHCAFVMAGAMGLEKKLVTLRDNNKVGYEEIMSRFGTHIMSIWPADKAKRAVIFREHAKAVAAVNCPEVDLADLLKPTGLERSQGITELQSLRRLTDNIDMYKKGFKTVKR